MTRRRDETRLTWDAGGAPVSVDFGDPYYSKADGLAEARHVFLAGNDLPGAWHGRNCFRIAELGFGTGLNVVAARWLWLRTRARETVLEITSFERFPLSAAQMARALGRWPELEPLATELVTRWAPVGGTFDFGDTRLEVIVGDARERLPGWDGLADAWFLDGFAPARNPEMWEPALLAEVFRHTVPGGSFATYSAAGAVRRALSEAGFAVERRPGFGPKRQMTRGRRPVGGEAMASG